MTKENSKTESYETPIRGLIVNQEQFLCSGLGAGRQEIACNRQLFIPPTVAVNLQKNQIAKKIFQSKTSYNSGKMKTIRWILFIILVFDSMTQLLSQTILVSGDINSNTTWSADTVKLTGDVNVLPGVLLAVEPGTYIESQGYYRINVAGSVKAIGTAADTIVFTVKDTSNFWQDEFSVSGGWAGFNLTNSPSSPDTTVFDYCKIQYGKKYDSNGDDIKGGVIKAIQYGTLIISNSILRCNMVINHEYSSAYGPVSLGGAVYCDSVNTVSIVHNKFEKNRSFDKGGAVYIGDDCHTDISYNTFIGNKAWNRKFVSGVYVSWGSGAAIETRDLYDLSPKISGNYFFNNYTVIGIILSKNQEGLIFNNLLCNNVGTGIAALYFFSTGRIFNNTIVNNDDHNGGIINYSNVLVYNNIVWGNKSFPSETPDQIQEIDPGASHPVLFNNCVEYGDGGPNSISSYPEFKDPTEGFGIEYNGAEADWSLVDLSPCINTGTPDTTGLFIPEFDIGGNPRIYGDQIELGCYENQFVLTNIIPEITADDKTSAYPNPGTNWLNIESCETGATLELITLNGQVTFRKQISDVLNCINTESIAPGFYFYKLINSDNKVFKTGKWIKK